VLPFDHDVVVRRRLIRMRSSVLFARCPGGVLWIAFLLVLGPIVVLGRNGYALSARKNTDADRPEISRMLTDANEHG